MASNEMCNNCHAFQHRLKQDTSFKITQNELSDPKGPAGWSGGAMVLGKLPVPGRATILITVGQGPIALAVGAGGVVWTFLLSSILLLSLPLFGRRPDRD